MIPGHLPSASSISPYTPQASSCTTDDIRLVGDMLDDKDNSVKIQALNTLKAFSGIRKFRLKIQVSPEAGGSGAEQHGLLILESLAQHRISGPVPEVASL